MELNTLIPNADDRWIVKGNYLMYKKYANVPIAFIEGDIAFIFLDLKIVKAISKLVEHLTNSEIEFYFISPEFSNPSADIKEYNQKVVSHYLFCYGNKHIFKEFKKINFDLIKNMVEFCDLNNCYDLIKPCFEEVKLKVYRNSHDWMSNKLVWDYPEEIRNEFDNLYRDIQISRII